MSNQSYEQANQLMSQYPEFCDFLGPCSEDSVRAAELALGLSFPPTYKRFLLEYGAGMFASSIIYGIVQEGFNNPGTPDAVWHTLTTRTEVELPMNYVIIYSMGDGEVFCLSCATAGEAPVVAFTPGLPVASQAEEVVAYDFGDFLLGQVQQNLKRRAR